MPSTYEPIASQTLGSNAATVTFSSIPSTYTDLLLVGNWTANGAASLEMRFNGDTGANYSDTWLLGNGSTASSSRDSNGTLFNTNVYAGSGGNVVGFFHILSYSNTSVNKTVLFGGGSASVIVNRSVGLYRSTSAISSIGISIFSGVSYLTGSTFSLYGIKAA